MADLNDRAIALAKELRRMSLENVYGDYTKTRMQDGAAMIDALVLRSRPSLSGESGDWQPIETMPPAELDGDEFCSERHFLTYNEPTATYDTAIIERDIHGRFDFNGFSLGVTHWTELTKLDPPSLAGRVNQSF